MLKEGIQQIIIENAQRGQGPRLAAGSYNFQFEVKYSCGSQAVCQGNLRTFRNEIPMGKKNIVLECIYWTNEIAMASLRSTLFHECHHLVRGYVIYAGKPMTSFKDAVITTRMVLNVPCITLAYMLISGLGEMLIIGLINGVSI